LTMRADSVTMPSAFPKPRESEDAMKQLRHLCVVVLLVAGMTLFAPKSHAENQDCSTTAAGSGEAIQCRMGNLLAKNGTVLANLKTKLSSCNNTDPKCAALQRHLNRAQNAHTRAVNVHNHTSADNYNQFSLTGHYNRNSNRKGGGGGGSPPDTVDTSYDATGAGSAGQTISDQLDDANSAMDDVTTTLANTPAPAPPPFTPLDVYDYNKDDAFPGWLHPEVDEKATIPALFAIKLAVNVLEVADVLAEHACNETLVVLGEGGNVSAACAPLALALVALKATAETMEFADSDLLYWTAKGAYINAQRGLEVGDQTGQNVQQAAGDIGAVRAKLDAIALYIDQTLNPDVNNIIARLKTLESDVLTNQALLREMLKMLLIPEGKRVLDPAILTCTGASCPNVLLQCTANGICAFPLK